MADTTAAADAHQRREPIPLLWRFAPAQFISTLGSTMALLGVALVAYRTSGDSIFHTILVSAAYSLPAAVFGLRAGRLADEHHRTQILLWTYGLKMVTFGSMAVLGIMGVLDANWLILVSLVGGTLGAFSYPAWQEYVKDVFPGDRLDEVNATFNTASSLATLIGAVVGGLLITAFGTTPVFVLNVLSYLPLLFVFAITRPTETVIGRRGRVHHQLRDTITFVRQVPQLRRGMIRIAVLSLLAAPLAQLLPEIASLVDSKPHTLGYLTAVFALGSTGVAVLVRRIKDRASSRTIVELDLLVTSVLLTAFGLAGWIIGARYAVVILALIPLGLAISTAQSVQTAMVQQATPANMAGPIFALYGMIYTVLAPLGGLTLGQISEHVSVWLVISAAGVGLTTFAVVELIIHRNARRAAGLPPPEVPLPLRHVHLDHALPILRPSRVLHHAHDHIVDRPSTAADDGPPGAGRHGRD